MTLAAQLSFRYHRVMRSVHVDLEKVRDFLDAREEQRRRRLGQRCEQANRDFRAIVGMIVSKYKPKRIWQWGSLLRPERFSEISDIDIALEGLGSPETCFAVLRDADGMTEFPLDIVELERIHPVHAENIRKKGKLIHEEP